MRRKERLVEEKEEEKEDVYVCEREGDDVWERTERRMVRERAGYCEKDKEGC